MTRDKRPSFGPADTMATGHNGKDFLTGLSMKWKTNLDKPVEQEMPDGKKRTYVNGRVGNGVPLSAGYAGHKHMPSLLCGTSTTRPDGFDFSEGPLSRGPSLHRCAFFPWHALPGDPLYGAEQMSSSLLFL